MRSGWRAPMARWLASLGAALIFAALTGCAVQTSALRASPPADLPARLELAGTPFFPQTEYQCGPSALATVLGAAGIAAQPGALGNEVFLPAREGTLQTEMLSGARRHGAVATLIPNTLEALLREVASGHPVVVMQNLGLKYVPLWHYAVLVGYDIADGDVLLRSGATERQVMAMRTLEYTWARSGYWAFTALPPGEWPTTATEAAVVEAAVGFERAASPEQALRAYDSALRRWPGNLSLAMGLGNAAYAGGDKVRAAEVFRAAAERHGSAPAWINLANVLLESNQAAQAETAARHALDKPAWQSQAQEVLQKAIALQAASRP